MNSRGLKYKLTVFLTVLIGGLFSQDLVSDMKKIHNRYHGGDCWQISLNYESYLNQVSGAPVEKQSGELFIQNKNTLQKIFNNEILKTESYSLLVNHEEKQIVKNYEFQEDQLNSSSAIPEYSKIPSFFNVESFTKSTDGKIGTYILKSKDEMQPVKNKVIVMFDLKNHDLKEIQLWFLGTSIIDEETNTNSGKPIVRLVYNTQTKIKRKKEQFFTDAKYLSKIDGKDVLNAPYQNYNLVVNK